jgi:hypothetical protein
MRFAIKKSLILNIVNIIEKGKLMGNPRRAKIGIAVPL